MKLTSIIVISTVLSCAVVSCKKSNKQKSAKWFNEIEKLLQKLGKELKDIELKSQNWATTNKDQDEVDPCSDQTLIIKNSSGVLYSPGYNVSEHGPNLTCTWLFWAPVGQVVKLEFKEMNLETSENCQNDIVTIWDVQYGSRVNLGRFCGKTMPMELLKSTDRYIFVKFTTNPFYNKGKFSIVWKFIDPQPREPSDVNCGRPAIQPSLKIVNGSRAVPHSWPWQISLRVLSDEEELIHICGGSIVSSSFVLTAAHCFFDSNHERFDITIMRVVAGDYDTTTTADGKIQVVKIRNVAIHEDYDHSLENAPNDIASIVLDDELSLNYAVSTICLPTEPPGITSLCYATGWGDTKDTGKDTVLNQVRLPVVSQTNCTQYSYYGCIMKDTMLCAGYDEGDEDTCQGDSGGPFVCLNEVNNRWYLQGITSFGEGCGGKEKPGVYTRVMKFLDWISNYTDASV